MDRISNLPDEIIHHIGSFLSAKEAAFATLLSKRWRNLFTIVPKLRFNGGSLKHFEDFVDVVLSLPLTSRVRTFSLKCKHEAQYEDLINRCLLHVVNRGLLVLKLHIKVGRQEHYYSLPPHVFTCKTVSTMKLGSGLLIQSLPDDVSLPALKSLFLDSVRFFDDGRPCAFKTLLSASPVLQELVMNGNKWERWKWCGVVSSTTLQRLTIRRGDFTTYEEGVIDGDPRGLAHEFDYVSFDTPALTYLEYSDYVPKEYPSVNLHSLVEANLNLCAAEEGVWEDEHADSFNPMNLIVGFKNVEVLNLTIETVEMFNVFNETIPMLEKVSQLSLALSNFHWFSVPNLMMKFPNLKTLIIEDSLHYGYHRDEEVVCECVSGYSFLLSCPVEVLKINDYDGSDEELEQMKHFLGKLSCLELVEVRAKAASSDVKLKITVDLLMLPRASTKCKVKVKFSR
ncbi:F-box domain-containing protein [Hirschfeldia incana]|nr:F-box domain-containing protein [Hirschfeldia incana]